MTNPAGYRNCNQPAHKIKLLPFSKKGDCALKTDPAWWWITALVLTRTIKFINSSQFLQSVPTFGTGNCNKTKPTAPELLKNYNKVITNQHIISIVPRHSYKPDSLYHDGKNCAVLRSLRPQKPITPIQVCTLRPPFDYATFTHFIAGPLAIICNRHEN